MDTAESEAMLTAADIPNIAQSQVTGLVTDLSAKTNTAALQGLLHNNTSAVETMNRGISSSTFTSTSGFQWFAFFTPITTITVSQVTMINAVAGSGLTLARMGLYTFDETTATLVAQTANDTTLFTTASTVYTRSFSTAGGYPATYTLEAGQRYALSHLCTGTTMPSFVGAAFTSLFNFLSPKPALIVTGRTDFIASATTFNNSPSLAYGRFS
jgi:hypothetical protein